MPLHDCLHPDMELRLDFGRGTEQLLFVVSDWQILDTSGLLYLIHQGLPPLHRFDNLPDCGVNKSEYISVYCAGKCKREEGFNPTAYTCNEMEGSGRRNRGYGRVPHRMGETALPYCGRLHVPLPG
jgi:hypothetical protein